jgi:lysophospholipase L1-like esterase
MKAALWLASALAGLAAPQAPPPAPSDPPTVHIVLVGDSTVTEGSGWGLGFRQLAGPGVTITNTAQNGRSSKSFRDEGHWAKALGLKGHYYLIQFGHNDQPGKGPERETDPATTYPANMARYVDEVRANGGVPILVTSLVRRTFSKTEPGRLTSTLGPWVDAVKRVAAEKRVPLVDLDASSRELCERLGPGQTHGFDIKKDDGTWDTTHLDASGSPVFAKLVIHGLRRVVPELSPLLREDADESAALEDPPDLPAPFPLVGNAPKGVRSTLRMGRVYTRELRLARHAARLRYNGREPDVSALPPLVTSPAILVAWDYVPVPPPPEQEPACGYGSKAPTRIEIKFDQVGPAPPEIQPLTVTLDRARIRELLAPFEADVDAVRWLAVLDPARLRPGSAFFWWALAPCEPSFRRSVTSGIIAQEDVDRWLRPLLAKP